MIAPFTVAALSTSRRHRLGRGARLGIGASLAALATLAACTGVTLDGGSAGDAPVGVDVSTKCAAAHGAAELPVTAAAFSRALVGRWLVCGHDQTSPQLLLAHDGFEFDATGQWFGLKPDTFGGYEHTVNPGTSGTYGLYVAGATVPSAPTDATPAASILVRLAEPALDLGVTFEVSPRRLHVTAGVEVWMVRLDDGPNEPVPYESKEGERCDAVTFCRPGLRCATEALPTDGGALGVCVVGP
jgi:hypothetical protein